MSRTLTTELRRTLLETEMSRIVTGLANGLNCRPEVICDAAASPSTRVELHRKLDVLLDVIVQLGSAPLVRSAKNGGK